MANYYTQYSFMVPFDDPDAALRAVELVNDWCGEFDSVDDPPETHPIYDVFGDEPEWRPEFDADQDGVWIRHDEGNLEQALALASWLLGQPSTPAEVEVEWAHTCSKARLGAFSGGAAVVTAEKVYYAPPAIETARAPRDNDTRPRSDASAEAEKQASDLLAAAGFVDGLPWEFLFTGYAFVAAVDGDKFADVARRMAPCEKDGTDEYASLTRMFGGVEVRVVTARENVCRRVGTRVERRTRLVTEDVEVPVWECGSVLGGDT